MLHFEQAQSIGYVEFPDGAVYVQDQDQVAAYTSDGAVAALRGAAAARVRRGDRGAARRIDLIGGGRHDSPRVARRMADADPQQ
ncbi:MAG: hypothetical protein ACRDSL_15830 [Pseudonocardiaceae bacterium]